MPRGRKAIPKSYEEQINLIETKIAEHKAASEQLKQQLKALRALKKEKEVEDLLTAIEQSGKSIAEIIAMIQQQIQP